MLVNSCDLWSPPESLFLQSNKLQKTMLSMTDNHLIELENKQNKMEYLVGLQQERYFNISMNIQIRSMSKYN